MEIMFDDLTFEAQERLLKEAGVSKPEDMHWDTSPVAVVDLREDNHELDDEDFADDIYDGGYDDYLD
jgi:hypothetical protein